MKIVSLEWFEQSLERGMVLDEALFNPTLPVEARGRGAWDRRSATPVHGKRTREGDQSQALNPFRRKLRRSASTKFGNQSESLWAGITAVNLDRQQDDGDEWNEPTIAQHAESSAHTPASRTGSAPTPGDTTSFVNPADAPVSPSCILAKASSADGLFQGRVVCPHGFDREKTNILRQHLSSHGARVLSTSDLNNISNDDMTLGFLIVPHDAEVDLAPIPDRAGSLVNIVSNWWVERCLHGKRLIDPADDVLSRPFGKLSVSGFSGLTVNSTGFAGIELLHVTKVVALLGATYDEQLSAQTSVIVCNSSGTNAQKLKFAAEKRIPAVTSAWLSDCVRNGRLQAYDEYRFSTTPTPRIQHVKPKPRASLDGRAGAGVEDGGSKPRPRISQTKIVTKPQVLRRPRTLELAPSADATPTQDSNINTPVNQDNSRIPNFDGATSLPLQNISVNSRRPSTSSTSLKSAPRARSRSSSAESLIRAHPAPGSRPSATARKTSPDSVIPADSLDQTVTAVPPQPQPQAQLPPKDVPAADKDYSDILAQLRANRKTAPESADAAEGQGRRRRRQLGRATSTRSNQSAASSGNAGTVNPSLDNNEDEEGESVLVEEYQPSQQLGWEEPGAAKAREAMIKKLGGTIKEKSVAVQGIGVVTDEGGEKEGRSVRKRRA
ncbi:hypothetical protein NX059_010907 [Plenodomus lindquistii]|nr:hypothetical protein NX059_010907 [Plenodomus lindquistii]